jgi:hypothetical protein
VVGGLAFSQVVTLFLTPVVYIYLEQAKQWSARSFGKQHRELEADTISSSHGPAAGGAIGAPMARSSTGISELGRQKRS